MTEINLPSIFSSLLNLLINNCKRFWFVVWLVNKIYLFCSVVSSPFDSEKPNNSKIFKELKIKTP